jgi:hypothetical protein
MCAYTSLVAGTPAGLSFSTALGSKQYGLRDYHAVRVSFDLLRSGARDQAFLRAVENTINGSWLHGGAHFARACTWSRAIQL